VLGATTCALFLSLRYHRLHPEYIYNRIQKLGKEYNLRILLVMVDIVSSLQLSLTPGQPF
jgi:DNA excision repair protein ERCC-1